MKSVALGGVVVPKIGVLAIVPPIPKESVMRALLIPAFLLLAFAGCQSTRVSVLIPARDGVPEVQISAEFSGEKSIFPAKNR